MVDLRQTSDSTSALPPISLSGVLFADGNLLAALSPRHRAITRFVVVLDATGDVIASNSAAADA